MVFNGESASLVARFFYVDDDDEDDEVFFGAVTTEELRLQMRVNDSKASGASLSLHFSTCHSS